jgi:hypothetical protein
VSTVLLRNIKARGGWLRVPLGFGYAVGRCSCRPCDRQPAVETNDGSYGGRAYHLCAHHAQVVGRRDWSGAEGRDRVPRVWRWLTTRVLS